MQPTARRHRGIRLGKTKPRLSKCDFDFGLIKQQCLGKFLYCNRHMLIKWYLNARLLVRSFFFPFLEHDYNSALPV